jgi:hypothetical protein
MVLEPGEREFHGSNAEKENRLVIGGLAMFVTLERDPEKWIPAFGKRSRYNKELERDADSAGIIALQPVAWMDGRSEN